MHASVNAATPLAVGDGIFMTSSYGAGAVLLKPDGKTFRSAWSGDESLSSHFATPVLVDGFLYGFHGRQESGCDFRCIEASSGKVRWSLERAGSGSVLAAGRKLLLLMESGEVRVLEANPEKPIEKGRFQAGGSGARALPALALGRFFFRDRAHLLCLEIPR
jgi:outer membrane protein assembly factor BamB